VSSEPSWMEDFGNISWNISLNLCQNCFLLNPTIDVKKNQIIASANKGHKLGSKKILDIV
jgi:hypothetical protein